MRKLQILLALSLLALPALAKDTSEVLSIPRQRVQTADFKVTGRLVRVAPSGQRFSGSLTIKAHWFPGILRIFVQLGQPAESHAEMRENILIEMRPDGQSSIRVMHPGDPEPLALSAEKWKSASIGPGFDVEDFVDPQYFWPAQSVAENVKYGARDCNLVTSKPGAQEPTDYSQIRTWLDSTIGFPVYVEKTVKASEAVKEFTYLGLRHDQGVWSASQIEAKLHGQQGSTLLIVEHGSAKANLTAADFTAAQLAKF
jgi:hypothetical protein